MKRLKNKRLLHSFPWRFFITSMLVISQIILTIALIWHAQSQYVWFSAGFSIIWLSFLLITVNRDEPASFKLPWVTVILIFPLAGAVLFLIFGTYKAPNNAQKRFFKVNPSKKELFSSDNATGVNALPLEKTSSYARGISNYLTNTSKIPPFGNTKSEFLSDGEQFFARLKQDITSAKDFILLEYFIISEGALWSEIYGLLVERASTGVTVLVLYDDLGSMKKTPFDFDKKCRADGISCYKFNPFKPVVSMIHNNRDHRKIAVIDGVVAYTGGINISDEYANLTSPFGKWKDCAVRMQGDVVNGFTAIFMENYNVSCEKPLDVRNFLRQSEPVDATGFVQPFADGPRPIDVDYIGQSLYLNVIYSAQRYLYITTPYFIVDSNFFEALDNCVKRGVEVVLLTPHVPDKKSIFTMTRSSYLRLIKSGVKIYEYEPGFIHSKTVVCDDKIAVVGTINFDYRSLVHHYECGAVFYGCDCINDIKQDFLKTIQRDGIMQTEKTAKLTLREKLVKNIIGLFAPML